MSQPTEGATGMELKKLKSPPDKQPLLKNGSLNRVEPYEEDKVEVKIEVCYSVAYRILPIKRTCPNKRTGSTFHG